MGDMQNGVVGIGNSACMGYWHMQGDCLSTRLFVPGPQIFIINKYLFMANNNICSL